MRKDGDEHDIAYECPSPIVQKLNPELYGNNTGTCDLHLLYFIIYLLIYLNIHF